jgi:hypothetical protein
MTEEIKDVNAQIDKAEEAVKKYASKDTVISIGGYEFTPAKLMVAATIVSSILGSLYGCFEVYKDYMDMKKKIANYVTPDLTEIYKKMEVLDANTSKMTEYTNNRLESVVENVERSSKQDSRATDQTVKDIKRDVDATLKQITTDVKDARKYTDDTIRDVNRDMVRNQKETSAELKALRTDMDDKIRKALDNPLSK